MRSEKIATTPKYSFGKKRIPPKKFDKAVWVFLKIRVENAEFRLVKSRDGDTTKRESTIGYSQKPWRGEEERRKRREGKGRSG